jgi:polyhydroxyalkanoate synthesis regulator phasin
MQKSHIFYLSLGMISLAKEKIEEQFMEFKKIFQQSCEQGKKFLQDNEQDIPRDKQALESLISEKTREAVQDLDLATRDDLKELKKELEKLLKSKDV